MQGETHGVTVKGRRSSEIEGRLGNVEVLVLYEHQPRPSIYSRLLDPRATTLNQNDQHDDKQHAGYNPDNRGLVHVDSPFVLMVE